MRTLTADRATVMAVPTPQFTATWHPIAHGDVLRAVYEAINLNELNLTNESHCLTRNGNNLFSTFTIDGAELPTIPGSRYQLGLRNSLNKQMAIGLVAGTNIVVCSNMMFSGQYLTFRKHTGRLDLNEVYFMAAKAVAQSIGKMANLANWQENLKQTSLPTNHLKQLTFDVMTTGGMAPSKLKAFLDMHKAETKLNGETVYSWHGACTRACREDSLLSIASKTPIINSIADDYLRKEAA